MTDLSSKEMVVWPLTQVIFKCVGLSGSGINISEVFQIDTTRDQPGSSRLTDITGKVC